MAEPRHSWELFQNSRYYIQVHHDPEVFMPKSTPDRTEVFNDTPTLMTVITPPPRPSAIELFEKNFSLNLPTILRSDALPPVELSSLAGTRWGSFELIRLVGHGAMGTVYEARDTVLDRHVALKILISNGLVASRKSTSQYLHEARIAARLDHPNIVTIYQVGEHEGSGYIAMQLVRGKSAAHDQPFTIEKSIRVVREIALALSHAHKHGLIHRDVKPENLLIGEDGSIKLADFGLAEMKTEKRLSSERDQVTGTPAFMSPEQALGLQMDPRSDLYSLGATWFALLTGKVPFRDSNFLKVMLAHIELPAPDVRSLRPDVPAPIAAIIAKLLSKSPEDRPASADELLIAIDASQVPSPKQSLKAHLARAACWAALACLLATPIGGKISLPSVNDNAANLPRPALIANNTKGSNVYQRLEIAPGPREAMALHHFQNEQLPRMPEPVAVKTASAEIPLLDASKTAVEKPTDTMKSVQAAETSSGGNAVRIPAALLGVGTFTTTPISKIGSPQISPFPFGITGPARLPPSPYRQGANR